MSVADVIHLELDALHPTGRWLNGPFPLWRFYAVAHDLTRPVKLTVSRSPNAASRQFKVFARAWHPPGDVVLCYRSPDPLNWREATDWGGTPVVYDFVECLHAPHPNPGKKGALLQNVAPGPDGLTPTLYWGEPVF
jgi:hypothetical protein